MPRNVARINNYYNRAAAWEDWQYVARKATAAGRADLVKAHTPRPTAGWRSIDRCIDAIRAEFGWPLVYEMRQQEPPEMPREGVGPF